MSSDYTREEILAAAGLSPQASPHQYSREEILQAAGITPPQQAQQPGFFDQASSFVKAIPGEVKGAGRQLATNPIRAGKVVEGSTLNATQGLLNLITKGLHYGTGGQFPEANMNQDYTKLIAGNKQQPGDVALGLAPYLASPELLSTKGMGRLAALATKGTEGAIWNKSAGGDASTGFALGAAPGVLGAAARGGRNIGANIKSPIVEGLARAGEKTTSPAQLEEAMRSTGDAPVNIGKVIRNPQVNEFYENRLAKVPGSGVAETQNSLATGVDQQGRQILEGLRPQGLEGEPDEFIKNSLLEEQSGRENIKRKHYKEEDKIAAEEGFQPEFPSFKKNADGYLKLINDQPFLKADPTLSNFVSTIEPYLQGGKSPSLVAARMAKDRLYHIAKTFGKSTTAAERLAGPAYKRMADDLGADINNSIATKGSSRLQKASSTANKYFAEEYAPFFDENIVEYLNEYKDPSALARRIINPSEVMDKHENIGRIMDLLPEDKKTALPYAYLSRAVDTEGKFDAKTFARMIGGLGNKQFKALFPNPEMQQKLLDYGRLRGMSEEALNLLYNPKTGARNQSSWAYTLASMAAGAKGGAAAGGAVGGPIGAASGAILGGVGAPLAMTASARGLSKAFTNPETRQKVVARILEKQQAAAAPKKATQAEKLAAKYGPRILAAQNERNQNGARQ